MTDVVTTELEATLAQLEALGSEQVRAQNRKQGAGDNQYGCKLGDIRKVAKPLKTNRDLALALWATGNVDARMLAILLLKPTMLSAEELDQMVRSIVFSRVADWFNAYLLKGHPDREQLRRQWLDDPNPWAARAAWFLTADRVAKRPDGLDMAALLDCIEADMAGAPPEVQWTMNTSLAEIGIRFPEHRERAITIGETLGLYRDYPVSKGCTSPFAPIWINEMVSRAN